MVDVVDVVAAVVNDVLAVAAAIVFEVGRGGSAGGSAAAASGCWCRLLYWCRLYSCFGTTAILLLLCVLICVLLLLCVPLCVLL